ncbi:bifunctional (p)ppGpp synthetase/guanosine-3',5'-bis(diphosphate) 3'-pyrophosphohydrolase [Niveibacterium sp. 24ML]|uniref:RelA/SpoT family protein n=1 Tax=Niveibacterium sp. 24ML TaxID=2985512 RepID=UPI00226DF5CB|nr:bifunctional (p)ppGpp synthetase/guanosine-3',5'-bis(diphosphate) 3'-pyrophosphohydrolase [Niveibacterium sp. 24ML]MCX9156707.1 bifunctional (p)ppGpp synthetase/guanosine-3',5'-bis(diphosphate) 3'-pyrophosphohydrolase [Niveibacterium sp. 24ML]
MVQVAHSLANSDSALPSAASLAEGLGEGAAAPLQAALEWIVPLYGEHTLNTGEPVLRHALGMTLITVSLRLDLETRLAAMLFAVVEYVDQPGEEIERRFGRDVARLTDGMARLSGLRLITRQAAQSTAPDVRAQTEVLRKMLLAMVEDIRVVLLRLASRTQTLRYLTEHECDSREELARESMALYAPLANRLGVWQLKWELEDLSFRFLEPQTYKRIAKMLDERRVEREAFIENATTRLRNDLAAAGVEAEVYGRPKHIYSIYNKMAAKHLDFSQVYDVRALRVLVHDVRECYTALGLVHSIWQPIAGEYDDYISKPKGNNYQSLHTAVRAADGRALEVQIRTLEMHRHAELGIAAHWRYKEGSRETGEYDEKIALLRQLLSWRDEISDSSQWESHYKNASLDDTIYVMTPQGRVVDLTSGATPIDFAYRVHTDLGHRCRGAKVNGQMVSLNTALENGQVVDIIAAKQGGPSRDWLNPQLGYLATSNARSKVRRWFTLQDEAETLSQGRTIALKELQREGHAHSSLDDLGSRLGFKNTDAFLIAVGRGDVGTRQIQLALRGDSSTPEPAPDVVIGRSRKRNSDDKILIVGVGRLLTNLGRCCKPAPPDAITGFVTRGKGVSIHRADCRDFKHLAIRHPERVVAAAWGASEAAANVADVYPIDIAVEANDRQGLLRDISEILSREKLNVIAVNTMSKSGRAFMRFTIEVRNASQAQRALTLIGDVSGVERARRA